MRFFVKFCKRLLTSLCLSIVCEEIWGFVRIPGSVNEITNEVDCPEQHTQHYSSQSATGGVFQPITGQGGKGEGGWVDWRCRC